MGWVTLSHAPENTGQGMKDFFESDYNGKTEHAEFKFLELSKKGNQVYVLYEIFDLKSQKRIITCDVILISFEKGQFSYKTINEASGPFYYDVPAKFLKALSPTESSMANKWREECLKVRENKKQKNELIKSLIPGTHIRFKEPIKFADEFISEFIVWDIKKSHFIKTGEVPKNIYCILEFEKKKFEIIKK